jgi:prolyl oligopeptidase
MTLPPYPDAPREGLTETLHGREVADPYRWLEDPVGPQSQEWLTAEDEIYATYMAAAPDRDRFATRLTELLAAGEVGTPAWRADRQFFTRREPGQEHAVLYTATAADGERALIDPTAIDPSGATTLDSWRPDHAGRLLAYQLSEGGTEESVLRIMDVLTGADVDGPIDRCRYTDVAWLPDSSAFYYTRRLPPEAVPPGEEQFHRRVYLHHVGKPTSDDVLILGDGLEKTNYYGVSVDADGRWLIITAAAGTAPRNDAWVAALAGGDPAAPRLRVLQQGVDVQTWPVAGRDGRLYLLTNSGAPRRKIAVADPADPEFPGQESWQDLVAEDPEAVLGDFAILDGQELADPVLLAARARHAISEIGVHRLADGSQAGTVALPGLGTAGGLSERPEGGHEAWFGYTDYATPGLVLRFDAVTGSTQVWQHPPGAINVPPVRAEQIPYESADGTTIRMVVLSAADDGREGADTEKAGELVPLKTRPAVLYGYGGFNISLTPAFTPAALAWVEAGGIYAVAGLRGGSEEGEAWHRAGMREHKQNVFDDFHAAAEKLISDGWTSSDQLAIWGGSNGGLLVGASVTQRPDLSAAAVCGAPLLDMVRYELFGLGETWNDEFGTAADPAELGWLLSYSPYHHVRPGIRYPAVLFTVFDGDTRVDPLHARKMCAALQHATTAPSAERPILLRRERDVGHGARAVSRTIALSAESLAFVAAQTGL